MSHNYKSKAKLSSKDIDELKALEKISYDFDHTNLKLELDYKESFFKEALDSDEYESLDCEFLAYDEGKLIAYLGICDFGCESIELNGMVHPEYRRQGIFTRLFTMFNETYQSETKKLILLLVDSSSVSGKKFIHKYTSLLHHSEYEMLLDTRVTLMDLPCDVELRLATNRDAYEIDLQNKIYFHYENTEDEINLNEVNPEDEMSRGFYIYLVYFEGQVVGKVNIQFGNDTNGIYGLGVKPEFRSRGIGRSILLRTIELIKKDNNKGIQLQVEVENDNALNLYKSCGFRETYSMNYFKYILS